MKNTENQHLLERGGSQNDLKFLWLELTNRCNLECLHCYANSGPAELSPSMTTENFREVLEEAASAGCRGVQFIGGEPTLDKALPALILHAKKVGFEFIEVYSNLNHVTSSLLDAIKKTGCRVATSIYGSSAVEHDRMTQRTGSFQRTVDAIAVINTLQIPLRAGIVLPPEEEQRANSIRAMLTSLGVQNVGVDFVRSIGRGKNLVRLQPSSTGDFDGLCGHCADGTLCISSDGSVSPCIMSKNLAVGNVKFGGISQIVNSKILAATRKRLYGAFQLRSENTASTCQPKCNPYLGCSPRCSPACEPCFPHGKCRPQVGT